MVTKPKISVVLTSYNHAKYIGKAIDSVLMQDFEDFELVIVDDCSIDNSEEIVQKFSDSRIRFIKNEKNLGMVRTVNKGIETARGEYIAHFNSDDLFYSKSKLSKQVEFLDANPEYGAVFTRAQLVDDKDQPFKDPKHSYYLKMDQQQNQSRYAWLGFFFYNSNCLCYPSSMVRKSVYENVGTFDPSYTIMQDLDMWIRICKETEIFILEENLTAFRISKDSTSCQQNNRFVSVFEFKKVLGNYLNISSVEEFHKIFPELPCDRIEDIAISVAKRCLNLSAKHKSFAVDFLFNSTNSQSDLDNLVRLGIDYKSLIHARNSVIIPKYESGKKVALIYNKDLRVASSRIRGYNVLEYFGKNKIRPILESYEEKNRAEYELVIFCKMFDLKNYILAQRLKAEGKKICFDLCDNHFYNPSDLQSYQDFQIQIKKMIEIADIVILSSKALRAVVLENIPESRNKITVIEDSFEEKLVSTHKPEKDVIRWLKFLKYKKLSSRMVRLVWFGNATSINAECGMTALLKIKDLIESYNKNYPICLTIVSNDKFLYRDIISKWDVKKTQYFKWEAATFIAILKHQDAALIPITKNPFTICKTGNRLIQSLTCGIDVLADSIPSYEEFKDCCFLDDWENGLKAVIEAKKDKSQKNQRIKKAKEIILAKYSIEIIAKKWCVLFSKIMG